MRFLFCIILYDYKDEEAADNKDDHILHNLMPSDNKDEEAAAKIIRDAINAFSQCLQAPIQRRTSVGKSLALPINN